MTAFEDYVNKGKTEINVMPVRVNSTKKDRPYLCPDCDRVWSYEYALGFIYYDDFPKRQPIKVCRRCDET
jgi:hypothetical protein